MEMCSLIVAPKKSPTAFQCLFVLLAVSQRTASINDFLGSFQHGISSKYGPEWCCLNEKEVRLGIKLKWMSAYECLVHTLCISWLHTYHPPEAVLSFLYTPIWTPAEGVFSGGSQDRVTSGPSLPASNLWSRDEQRPRPCTKRGFKWGSQFKLWLFKWLLHVAQEGGGPLIFYTLGNQPGPSEMHFD